MVIDLSHPLHPHQSRHQHQQSRLWQVEIGHQRIGHPELITRIDENIRRPDPRLHHPRRRRRLDQPQRRRPDRNDPPAGRLGGVNFRRRPHRHLTPFGMHLVGGHILDLDGQKRPRADMQRHFGKTNPLGRQRRQQICVEMQRGGRRGHRPGMACEHCLIIHKVLRIRRALGGDIGRQRHRPHRVQGAVKIIARSIELQHQIAVTLGDHRGRQPL